MSESVYENIVFLPGSSSAVLKDDRNSCEDIYMNQVRETQVTRCKKETMTSGTLTHSHLYTDIN